MLIVAVDTSGRKGSIALCRGDDRSFEVLQLTSLEGGTYSAQLMPRIAEALQQRKLDKTQVEGFVVVSGPGSFTGLRVGLATVKGLCEVLNKPLVTVSMLEAVVVTHGASGKTKTAVLDAGRGEVYVGDYGVAEKGATLIREFIVKLGEFDASGYSSQELLTPDKPVADFLKQKGAVIRLVASVQADEIGRIGIRKRLAGDLVNHATVDVNYIRRSDAEIFSAPKR